MIKRPQVLASKVKFDFQLHDICILIVLCFFYSPNICQPNPAIRGSQNMVNLGSPIDSRNLETSGWCILINVNISHI